MLDPETTGYQGDVEAWAANWEFTQWQQDLSPTDIAIIDYFLDLVETDRFVSLIEANIVTTITTGPNGPTGTSTANLTTPEAIEAFVEMSVGGGHYDGLIEMMNGDPWDWIYSDYFQGVGQDYCPANFAWYFYI